MAIIERSTATIPLRQQIRDFIMERIHSGHLAPHDPVPTVAELESQFGASKPTVHFVVDSLIQEGVLYRRRRGLHPGVFVSDPNAPKEEQGASKAPSEGREAPKAEAKCVLGHRFWVPSSGIQEAPVCQLCGMRAAFTGRFSPGLKLSPSLVVPPAQQAGLYSLRLPDGVTFYTG